MPTRTRQAARKPETPAAPGPDSERAPRRAGTRVAAGQDAERVPRRAGTRAAPGQDAERAPRRTLEPRGGTPLYQQVRDALKAELSRGTWKPGNLMPTELELGEQFGVSPGTVKQAVLSLVREGLVVRQAGRGTFVARLDRSRSFARFFRFRESSTGEELHPTIRVVGTRITAQVPADARRHLKLAPKAKVLFVRRLLSQDDTPICIYDSYMPYAMVAGLEQERLDVDRIYHAIEKRFDIHVVSVEEMLRADIVSGREAALLSVPAGSPVIKIERVAFTHNDTVVEWRQTIGRSDHFIYKIRMPQSDD